jgi:hypothetical protein
MRLNCSESVKPWCGVICLDMPCGVVYNVLDRWCLVVEAGSFARVSGLSMHVTLSW